MYLDQGALNETKASPLATSPFARPGAAQVRLPVPRPARKAPMPEHALPEQAARAALAGR
ncbi:MULTISPECIES: hypothetical protein [unclassified Streptomyces]|uniref:hypothetical protein n=1 Tax=unclassified Streptomyces TaxID=2593676 RepID=UPI0036E2C2FD